MRFEKPCIMLKPPSFTMTRYWVYRTFLNHVTQFLRFVFERREVWIVLIRTIAVRRYRGSEQSLRKKREELILHNVFR